MNAHARTTTIWRVLAIVLVSSALVSAQSEKLKREFDWTDNSYFLGARPTTVGVLLVTYYAFAERNGEKVHLDPKLDAATAQKSPALWFAYKAELDNTKATQQVRDEVVSLTGASLKGFGFTSHVAAMENQDTLQASLGRLPKCDCYLVIGIADVGPRLMVIGSEQSPIAQATTDFVLLSSDLKPVAGRSLFLLQPLKTVGKLEKDYETANPFQEVAAFRFTTKALVDSVAPAVRDGLVKPFAEALKASILLGMQGR